MIRVMTVLAFVAMAACAGIRARDMALLPAVKTAWTSVQQDVLRGDPELVVEVADLTAAFDSGDRVQIAIVAGRTIDTLLEAAQSGIDARLVAGEIGLGVAASLRERLRLFEESIEKLVSR
jgi:hypothetical protein